jgi:ubiquitin C-terminal hydrolase
VTGGKLGLKNTLSYCCINSIVQCLASTLPLVDYIFTNKIQAHNDKSAVYTSFSTLLYKLFHEKFNQDCRGLSKVLGKQPGVQYDSCETLFEILDYIHYAIKTKVDFTINGVELVKSDKLLIKGFESWIDHFKDGYYSFIIQNFYGNSVITHTNCICKEKFEPFNSLMLPITGGTLNECLDSYFAPEKCNCNCKNGTRKINLWNLPDTLIISFKRYNSNGAKITAFVDYPLEIELGNYISSLKCDNNKYLYSLYAVNYHNGDCNTGHYWSCCKDITDTWYKYDDDNVEKVNDTTCISNTNAYILFYQRIRITL